MGPPRDEPHHHPKPEKLERAEPIDELENALKSVMKIYVTLVEPDYTQPWTVFMEEECTGSGFAIDVGELVIVTNAHVVASHADIRIRKFGQVHKWKARSLVIAHTADVALLAVEDARFWKGVEPLEFGDLPRLYETVKCVGYTMGGDNACVTRGVVSRVDTTSYVRGAEQLLVVQIDAAINSGNSGGPALDDNSRVAGVAFSGYAGTADNIGYIIPRVVVSNVVDEYLKTKKWAGLCNLGISTQSCENPALRKRLKMDDVTGVLVTRVAALGCCAKAGVKAGDVLISLDSVSVANDGTVPLRGSERVHADHLVTSKLSGKEIDVEILRDGDAIRLRATLSPLPRLVPLVDGFDADPAYVVVGGLVLMALSVPLISAMSDDDDDSFDLRFADYLEKDKAEPDAQIVVWTQTLSHDVNFGYNQLCHHLPRLHRLNSEPVKSLAHVVSMTATPAQSSTTFWEFEFLPPGGASPVLVVVDAEASQAAEPALLKRSKVPAPYSPDLKLTKPKPRRPRNRNKHHHPPKKSPKNHADSTTADATTTSSSGDPPATTAGEGGPPPKQQQQQQQQQQNGTDDTT
ncbi:hypothetical protein CTAYLR_005381 [Chrysophaeum taylorii]|uniref:Protease Do-like PDZ domain-containing protein n=1 Tax=Chrysophaeum taylorii TaxID=2483200 RepID=A0AAD7U7D3_9STRA|nr:hypothetical protein CTAYLR_005381 [Chrysophaeum taylorii]